jgi:arginyl-tRNA synthetase
MLKHEDIINAVKDIFGIEISDKQVQFQQTKKEFEGDITLVVFPFVKLAKAAPPVVGEKIGEYLVKNIDFVTGYNTVQGFLNITFSSEYWLDFLTEINSSNNYGFKNNNSTGETYMVEFASPNTNKPLHLGHLRNIFLGFSVAKILKANGHKVVKTQIINDRGIHICKSMVAWQQFAPTTNGKRETPLSTGDKGDKFVGKYYVKFDQELNKQVQEYIDAWENNDFSNLDSDTTKKIQDLIIAKSNKEEKVVKDIDSKIKDIAKPLTSLMIDANSTLVKWEARDPETYLLWQTMNGWVYTGFDVTYETMGVDFDSLYYESDTYLIGKEIIEKGLAENTFFKKEDGSVWIDLTDEGLDEKLLLRGNGTAVYITQDIGTAVERYKNHPDLNGIIYTVGNEQDYHFKVLFLILKKMGYSWAENCSHLSYGMVDLPTGKMKSREGTVVDADDLMQEVIDKARDMTQERGHIEGFSQESKEELFKTIGLGGLKYYLLKVDPKKRMLFNPEESVELNGNTGPFIQYAYARIQSLLRKENLVKYNTSNIELLSIERELIKTLSLFPETLKEAGEEQSPALIANYSYELVKTFNSFYQSTGILNEENEDQKIFRLTLSKNIANVIKNSMDLIGINVPNKM